MVGIDPRLRKLPEVHDHLWPLLSTMQSAFAASFRPDALQDATALKEQGIWLGDYDEEKTVVNELCYDDVQREYFFQTDAGSRKGYEEPFVFDVGDGPQIESFAFTNSHLGSH